MLFLFQLFFILFNFILFYTQPIEANQQRILKNNPSLYLSDELWQQVQDYLMPDDHPMKPKLDQIFSESRALSDRKSMIAAGFASAKPQSITQITVTKHPELPGYVIKAYLDSTGNGRKNKLEEEFLIKRILGARLVRESIKTHNYEHLIKVPEKWLYLLPDEPSPPSNYSRRRFILVENDMDVFSDKKNKKLWSSDWVTKELLEALYTVTTEVGLADSTKPKNCPFSQDGRVALLDTQVFNRKFVKYEKLTPYLSSAMKIYWHKLTNNKAFGVWRKEKPHKI